MMTLAQIIETELGADPKSSLETSSDRHEPDASPVVNLPDPSPPLAHDGEPKPSSTAWCAKSDETEPLVVGQVGPRPGSHEVSNVEQAVPHSDAEPAFHSEGKAA